MNSDAPSNLLPEDEDVPNCEAIVDDGGRQAIAWCAWSDVRDGVAHDDPTEAVRGWERAAQRADQDPLVAAVQRLGISEAAQIYAQARAAAQAVGLRDAAEDQRATRTAVAAEISTRRKRRTTQ